MLLIFTEISIITILTIIGVAQLGNDTSKQLPQVKIALIGPSNSGKTAFLYTLGGRDVAEIKSTKEAVPVGFTRTFYRVSGGKKIPLETYRLIIIDLPGASGYENIRAMNLSKCTGVILFYDSTDPRSPRLLREIVRDEIIDGGFLSNILGIVLVGTKKDLGINLDAIKIAKEIEEELGREVTKMWNYKLPHLLINSLNKNEVEAVLSILESLLMSLSLQENLVKTLSVETVLGKPTPEKVPKQVEKKEAKPQPTPDLKLEEKVTVAEKTRGGPSPAHVEFELFPVDRIWQILSELGKSFEEVESLILVRKASDRLIYVAFYPGARSKDNIPRDLIKILMEADFSINNLVREADVGTLSHVILYGSEKSIIFVRKKAGLLVVKTYSRPSNELLELLLK